jgi:hypothetical protein
MNLKISILSRPQSWILLYALLVWACPMATRVWGQPASFPSKNFWRTDGPVFKVLVTNETVYLGGDFSYVGPNTGGAGLVDLQSGQAQRTFPRVEGTVSAAVSDGNGGWFIGGSFTSVGGVAQLNLAHIRGDNSIDLSWRVNPNGTVSALAVANGAVYVGGSFNQIAGQSRNRLAALDLVSGIPTGWNPNVGGAVLAIAPAGNTIYVGGSFSQAGGQQRGRVAAINAEGQVQPWNPNAPQGQVNALIVDGTVVYVAGTFTTIGGRSVTSWRRSA